MTNEVKQYQTETIAKLSEALAKAQGGIKHAEKSAKNPFFKSNYADLPAVIDAAKSELSANGLSVTQFTDIINDKIILITQLNHSSGEWIRGFYPVNPVKSDPQSIGACITYARRYAFCAIVGVAAIDEDDDGNLASGNTRPDKEPKSVFSNASLRKTFCDNVIKSFEDCETVEEANTVVQLNKSKMDDMRASGNEHDEMAVDELSKRYKLRLVAIKEQENLNQMKQDFSERK